MSTEMLPYGELLYDESSMPKGERIRQETRQLMTAQAIVLFLGALLLTYLIVRYYGSHPVIDQAGLLGMFFAYLMAIYSFRVAITTGYNRIYEQGIVKTKAHSSKVTFWPFSSIEKITIVRPESRRPYVVVRFNKGLNPRKLGSLETLFAYKDKIADFDSFVCALRDRVPLENMEPQSWE